MDSCFGAPLCLQVSDPATIEKLEQLLGQAASSAWRGEADLNRLLGSNHQGDRFTFDALAAQLAARGGRLHSVSAASGGGKSTIVAALIGHLRGAGVRVAFHLCKHRWGSWDLIPHCTWLTSMTDFIANTVCFTSGFTNCV